MPVMRILKKNIADEVTWQYDSEVLHRDATSITVEAFFNREDMPFQEIILKRNDRFVETFYTDKWYNIFEIYDRDNGKLKGWYCNLTKPAVIEDGHVAYVDLALDLWVSADGSRKVLDEDELEDLGLDEATKQKVFAGLRELEQHFESKNPPR